MGERGPGKGDQRHKSSTSKCSLPSSGHSSPTPSLHVKFLALLKGLFVSSPWPRFMDQTQPPMGGSYVDLCGHEPRVHSGSESCPGGAVPLTWLTVDPITKTMPRPRRNKGVL